MPDKDDDIGFSFDPKPFLDGLAQVVSGLGALDKKSVSSQRVLQEAFSSPKSRITSAATALKKFKLDTSVLDSGVAGAMRKSAPKKIPTIPKLPDGPEVAPVVANAIRRKKAPIPTIQSERVESVAPMVAKTIRRHKAPPVAAMKIEPVTPVAKEVAEAVAPKRKPVAKEVAEAVAPKRKPVAKEVAEAVAPKRRPVAKRIAEVVTPKRKDAAPAAMQEISNNGKKAFGVVQKAGELSATAIGRAFKGAMLKVAGIGLAIKGGLSLIKEFMPEIGQAMGIAKDIFFKNLLWPLRQVVAPYLQQFLNWVRDNRAMFVRWGQTLANVFKVVVMVVKTLWTTMKSVIAIFEPFIRKVFHGGIQDFIDLILTKVAVILAWLANGLNNLLPALQPIADAIGKIVDAVAKFTWGLFKGFLDEINKPNFRKSVHDLAQAFDDLATTLFGGHDWKAIGETVGRGIADGLKIGLDAITWIIDQIGLMVDNFKRASWEIESVKDMIIGKQTWAQHQAEEEWLAQGRDPRNGAPGYLPFIAKQYNAEQSGNPFGFQSDITANEHDPSDIASAGAAARAKSETEAAKRAADFKAISFSTGRNSPITGSTLGHAYEQYLAGQKKTLNQQTVDKMPTVHIDMGQWTVNGAVDPHLARKTAEKASKQVYLNVLQSLVAQGAY